MNLARSSWNTEHGSIGITTKHRFFENGSPGQTTMFTRFVSTFCVEFRSPLSNTSCISHHDPQIIRTTPNIVSWPGCQPEFPDNADGGGGNARSLRAKSPSYTGQNQKPRSRNRKLGIENRGPKSRHPEPASSSEESRARHAM